MSKCVRFQLYSRLTHFVLVWTALMTGAVRCSLSADKCSFYKHYARDINLGRALVPFGICSFVLILIG